MQYFTRILQNKNASLAPIPHRSPFVIEQVATLTL